MLYCKKLFASKGMDNSGAVSLVNLVDLYLLDKERNFIETYLSRGIRDFRFWFQKYKIIWPY